MRKFFFVFFVTVSTILYAQAIEIGPLTQESDFWTSYESLITEQGKFEDDPLKQLTDENLDAFESCIGRDFNVDICVNEFNGVVKE